MNLPTPFSTTWKPQVDRFFSRGAPDLDAFEELAFGLVELNRLLLTAPDEVLTSYDTLTEAELDEWRFVWDRRLVDGALDNDIQFADRRNCALQLGGLIRAWDRLLLSMQTQLGPVSDAEDWLFGEHYVIPRKHDSDRKPRARNQGYRVRGLVHHRIVPAKVGDLQLDVMPLATVEDDPYHPRRRFGAAVFKDFELDVVHQAGKFHATGLNSNDHVSEIQNQLDASSTDECYIIAWPELSMPSAHRSEVLRILKKNPDHKIFPDIVVTGSWHEMEDGNRYNMSHIFSRYGKPIGKCRKSVLYSDNTYGTEDIELGKTLPLIVTDSAIVSIGICKDFCTTNRKEKAYHAIKVDVVIVPSMGTLSTIIEHKNAANDLRNAVGGRVFVVQQNIPRNDGPGAFVLPPLRDKDDSAIQLEYGTTWKSFD